MSGFKFGLNGLSSFVQNRFSSYSSVSTKDPNDIVRERLKNSKSTPKVSTPCEKYANHSDSINTLAVVRPGMVLSGSRDRKIVLTNTDIGDKSLSWSGHSMEVTKLAYRNTVAKQTILSGSRDTNINMWLFNPTTPVRTFSGHRLSVTGLAYLDDKKFISGGRDASVKLWDIETGNPYMTKDINRNLVTHISTSSSLNLIAQSSEDKSIRIFDPRTLNDVQHYATKEHIQTHVEFIENSYICLSCSNGFNNDGCEITIYDIRYGPKPVKELRGHEGSVTCLTTLQLTETRKIIVSVGLDKTIRLWRLEEMNLAWTEDSPFEADSMQCIAYPDGNHSSIIVSGGNGRLAHYQVRFQAGRIMLDELWVQSRAISTSTSQNF